MSAYSLHVAPQQGAHLIQSNLMKTKSAAIKYAQAIVGQLYPIGDSYSYNAGNRQATPREYWAARAARAQSLIDYAHQYLGTESPQYDGGTWIYYVIGGVK